MSIKKFQIFFQKICLFGIIFLTNFPAAKSEIIDVQNEEKTFGDWKVFCEIDTMMDISHCKLAAKFYDSSSVINMEPAGKSWTQFFIIIPQIKIGSFLKVRVDKNDLILSQNINTKDFGLIPLNEAQKQTIFQQMKDGNFLFIRFNLRDSDKEITVRINLRDFRNALNYCVAKSSSS